MGMVDLMVNDKNELSLEVFTEKEGNAEQTVKNRLLMAIKKTLYKSKTFEQSLNLGNRLYLNDNNVVESKIEIKTKKVLTEEYENALELELLEIKCIVLYGAINLFFIYKNGITKEPLYNYSFNTLQ